MIMSANSIIAHRHTAVNERRLFTKMKRHGIIYYTKTLTNLAIVSGNNLKKYMKKTISLVLVFAFVFALALQLPALAEDNSEATSTATLTATSVAATSTATTSLEKIPSPDKINLFNQIKKIGTDLFGVRKATSTILKIESNQGVATSTIAKKVAAAQKAGLEKITSIDQVKFFEKITKIGNDLFGIKKKGANVLPAMSSSTIACVSAVIDAKDTKINEALTTATSEITAAITARGTCQKAALALTSGREDAIQTCNKAFQNAIKTANNKAKKSQNDIWTSYKTSLKACSATASSTAIMIEDSGDALK